MPRWTRPPFLRPLRALRLRPSAHRVAPLAGMTCVVALGVASCGTTDVSVLSEQDIGAGPDGGSNVEAGGTTDGASSVDGGSSRAAYCAGSGPPTLVDATDAGAVSTCAGQLAQASFRYALCTCDGYVGSQALTTDAFDSSAGPYDPAHALPGGSVGTNGNLNASGPMTVGGSLWVSDTTGLTSNAAIAAAGELHVQGEIHSGPSLRVGTDAWMASGIQTAGDLTVKGTLRIPTGAPLSVGGTKSVGTVTNTPVQVAPACDCAPQDLVDIGGYVASYRAQNDDAAAGIDPKLLENVKAPLTATIPCGRIFFTRVGGTAPIHLTAQGRVALFVGGDLSTTSDFLVDVPAGSELDLFVEGNVTVGGAFRAGSAANPSKARTYVGGNGTVNLQGQAELAGNLYAPAAQLVLGGSAATTLYGSIFAARINAGADLTIHYDEAILASGGAGAGCAPPTSCKTCRDCGGQACNSGTCGGCTDSSQCCAPLVCRAGACIATVQ